jgi:signal transduction histidine kinase
MKRPALLTLLVAGAALGLVAEHYSISADWWESPWLDLAVGWTYMAAGLVAWWRRPRNRIGPLMTAFGFSWFMGNFAAAPAPVFVSLGTAFESLSGAILAHLILAYPEGRLHRRSERLLVTALYVWVLASGFALAFTYDPPRLYGCACPSGGLAFFPSLGAFDALTAVRDVMAAIFAVGVIALVVRRYLRSSPVARRDLAPLWLAATLVALAFVLESLGGVVAPEGALDHSLSEARKVLELLVPLAFLGGLLRSRLAETTVAQLVKALDRPLQRGALRELLARAVGDPTLRLAFAAPDGDGFVDEDGRRVDLPTEGSDSAVTFVEAERGPCAAFVHDRALLERQSLVEAVGAAAGLALEKERLQAEVRAQLEEVRASRARIVETADAERRRVERDLHDGAQQRLVTLSLALGLAREQAASNRDETLSSSLAEACEEAARALNELRELGRGLHPTILAEAGLGPALESLAERSSVPATVAAAPNGRLPEAVEIGAYFVASEALANVAKHADASRVTLSAHRNNGVLVLEVADDGCGGADPARGSGLTGLEDRVAALGGRLSVESPSGAGTRIVAEIPCA